MNMLKTLPLTAVFEGVLPANVIPAGMVSGVAIDSRKVTEGGLFLACPGVAGHGLDYIEQAISNGCSLIAWEATERFTDIECDIAAIEIPGLSQKLGRIASNVYASPSAKMNLVGITGTNGKTSVSHFLAQALQAMGQECGLSGTLGMGSLHALGQVANTTSDIFTTNAWLADCVDLGMKHAAMEVSSHALDQGRIDGVQIAQAVFTNLSRDHLDYHGSMQAYAEAKKSLFTRPEVKAMVINVDDNVGAEWFAEFKADITVIGYSLAVHDKDHILSAKVLKQSAQGMHLQVQFNGQSIALESTLIADFNAQNLLAVIAVLLSQKITLADAIKAVASIKAVPGRLEAFSYVGKPVVVVDYAHTPDALEKALQTLKSLTDHNVYCVFGCGGDRDKGKRALMGEVAVALADHIVITSDNPRSEKPESIASDILQGLDASDSINVILDRETAIAQTIVKAGANDVVLIAGKGHETYQIIGDQVIDLDDRQLVDHYLQERAA